MTRPKIGIVVRKKKGAPEYDTSKADQLVQKESTPSFQFADQKRHQQFSDKIFALVR